MVPPARVGQLVNHRLGSASPGEIQFAPVDLFLWMCAALLVPAYKAGDLSFAISFDAFLPDTLVALDSCSGALQQDAFPEAVILDSLGCGTALLAGGKLPASGIHGRSRNMLAAQAPWSDEQQGEWR
jgi:hypothetical protein